MEFDCGAVSSFLSWKSVGIGLLCGMFGCAVTAAVVSSYAQPLSQNIDLLVGEGVVFFIFGYLMQGAADK